MDPISREEALAKIRELGLPSVVLDAFEGRALPEVLSDEMQSPRQVFREGQSDYPPGSVIPLFAKPSSGDRIVALRERGGVAGFMEFTCEGPALLEEGQSWEQIIAPVLIGLWENHSGDDLQAAATVREAAALLAFPFVERLLAAVKDPAVKENYEAWRGRLIAALPSYRSGERDGQRPASAGSD